MKMYQQSKWLEVTGRMLIAFCLTGSMFCGWLGSSASAEPVRIVPYGHVELDTLYSSRNTNPLDPDQFNGYVTAAGPGKNDSLSFDSRFLLLGVKSEWKEGDLSLTAVGEFDFWGSDKVGLTVPRLRLANINYGTAQTRLIVGQDWTPIMTLHPDVLDFSIMGYGGNLWQRIPQITFKQKYDNGLEFAATLMRFERSSFAEQLQMPFIGARLGYSAERCLVALSGAYRRVPLAGLDTSVVSALAGLEASLPLGPVILSLELARGQGLGAEFFRFGQEFNGSTAIRTTVGWAELGYAFSDWSLHAGYGLDDPDDADLAGVSNFANYLRNQRVFANAIYTLTGGFKMGAEYTYVATDWSNQTTLAGSQGMLSFFYDF